VWKRLALRCIHALEVAQRFPIFIHLVDRKLLGGDELLDLLVLPVERLDHTPAVLDVRVESPL
jgi:hypothetical protein